MANSTVYKSKWNPVVEPRRAKPKTYRQAPTHWLKFYEEAVIDSEPHEATDPYHMKKWRKSLMKTEVWYVMQ